MPQSIHKKLLQAIWISLDAFLKGLLEVMNTFWSATILMPITLEEYPLRTEKDPLYYKPGKNSNQHLHKLAQHQEHMFWTMRHQVTYCMLLKNKVWIISQYHHTNTATIQRNVLYKHLRNILKLHQQEQIQIFHSQNGTG